MKILKLNKIEVAEKVGKFLTSTDAFVHIWFPNEKELVIKAVFDSLKDKNHQYWYAEEDGKIAGAIGVRENHCNNGGYEMDDDYVAVHKDYRRRGIASKLLDEIESYVISHKGRYIHILTCDIDSYKPARAFYESRGYKKVAEMPNYYNVGEGRIDYYKEIKC